MDDKLIFMLCCASLIAAAFGPIYLPATMSIAWLAAIIWRKSKRSSKSLDIEIKILTERITKRGNVDSRILDTVATELQEGWSITDSISESISRYRISGDANDLRIKNKENCRRCDAFIEVLRITASKNDPDMFRSEMKNLSAKFKADDESELKNKGAVSNSFFITSIGSSFFFPVFAGIGVNIVSFAGQTIPGRWYESVVLAAFGYILIASWIGQRKGHLTERAVYASFSGIIGISVLRFASLLSGMML